MNQSKKDMESLQNELSNADKEISVSKPANSSVCLIKKKQSLLINEHVSFSRVWGRKWSSFRRLWARRRGQTKPWVGSCLKGACCAAIGRTSPNTCDEFSWKQSHAGLCWWRFSAYLSARPRWSWSSPAFASLQIARTLTSIWPMTCLHQRMLPRGRRTSRLRRCVLSLQCKSFVTRVFLCSEEVVEAETSELCVSKLKLSLKPFCFQKIQTQGEKFNFNRGTFWKSLN